jgi:predicted ATP-dependent endonuclease of OLD family
MRFKKFTIENYKGITSPIEIDFTKKSLFPIIGVNECGKTTILNAIFAFDYYNDGYDDSIHHLTDVRNLYSIENKHAQISATIDISKEDLKEIIEEHLNENNENQPQKKFRFPRAYKQENIELTITRIIDADANPYQISNMELFSSIADKQSLIEKIISYLPYILYFDDFKDSFPDKIEIKRTDRDNNQTWLNIIEQLFLQTSPHHNVYELATLESRRRKSILGDVAKHLNKSLTKEWANFKLEEKEPLQIAIEYWSEVEESKKELSTIGENKLIIKNTEDVKVTKHYLKFEVIDKDPDGNERFFYVRDRSKGFYWFFNFVMKLEFNPKINGSDNNAIYLLDEPGCYLHSFAQARLCKKLKSLSEKHKVLYCTHSHYLLNPQVIPLNSIHIANKSDYGQVELIPYYNYKVKDNQFPTSFQTIFDALHLQPLPYELIHKSTILVEGIYDYYAHLLFAPKKEINIIPCRGASTISQFISLMIGFKIDYKALWDNDEEGVKELNAATSFFGDDEARKNFCLLPTVKDGKKRILQDLFDGEDIVIIKKELGLNKTTSFEKTISTLYFCPKRESILKLLTSKTFDNFRSVYVKLNLL